MRATKNYAKQEEPM